MTVARAVMTGKARAVTVMPRPRVVIAVMTAHAATTARAANSDRKMPHR